MSKPLSFYSPSIPLYNIIESKFGQVLIVYKKNEGRYFLYKYIDDDNYDIKSFLMYDEQTLCYRFNGHDYLEQDFIKVLNLLVFV